MLKSLELCLHITKGPSYLTTSVVSANATKSKQSKQALYLHQALLHLLFFCCSTLKLTLPVQGCTSCCFFRLMSLTHSSCPITTFISIHYSFSCCVSRGSLRSEAPSLNREPSLCTRPSSSEHPDAAVALQDGAFPALLLSKLWWLVHAQLV